MTIRMVCDKEDGQGKGRTNNERVATAGKDGKDEKEGTDVFREVGKGGSTHSTSLCYFNSHNSI